VIFCELDDVAQDDLGNRLAGVQCLYLSDRHASVAVRFQSYVERVIAEIRRLFRRSSDGPVLLQVVFSTQKERQLFGGLAGVLKTAQLENPRFAWQTIGFDTTIDAAAVAARVQYDSATLDRQISYRDGRRLAARWRQATALRSESLWKPQGVYLMTGGAGASDLSLPPR